MRTIYIYLITCCIVFIYLIARVLYVPILHDEAATYLHYVQSNNYMPFFALWDANNHLLNSFLCATIFKIFGQELWALRLPNLLSFIPFCIFVYLISKKIRSKNLQFIFLSSHVLIHGVIEYFGYARGYAMSFACLYATLYYFIQLINTKKWKYIIGIGVANLLMLLANLTLINTSIILAGLLTFYLFSFKKYAQLLSSIFLFGLPIVGAAILSLYLKKFGCLYYGFDDSFISSLDSLVELCISFQYKPITYIFVVLGVSVFTLILLKLKVLYFDRIKQNPLILYCTLFVGNIAAIFAMHLILKVNYPSDRTFLFVYFYFIGSLILLLDQYYKNVKWTAFILLIIPAHSIYHANLSHSTYWYFDKMDYSFYEKIKELEMNNPNKGLISIGGYQMQQLIYTYYNQKNNGIFNDIQTVDYLSDYYDYLFMYTNNPRYSEVQKKYDVLISEPVSNMVLLKRKTKIELNLLHQFSINDISGANEFSGIYESDTLKSQNLCFRIQATIDGNNKFINGAFVLNVLKGDKEVYYETQNLHFINHHYSNNYSFDHSIYFSNSNLEFDKVKLYYWNIKKKPVEIRDVRVSVYSW